MYVFGGGRDTRKSSLGEVPSPEAMWKTACVVIPALRQQRIAGSLGVPRLSLIGEPPDPDSESQIEDSSGGRTIEVGSGLQK